MRQFKVKLENTLAENPQIYQTTFPIRAARFYQKDHNVESGSRINVFCLMTGSRNSYTLGEDGILRRS
jgi:hypothetical protein